MNSTSYERLPATEEQDHTEEIEFANPSRYSDDPDVLDIRPPIYYGEGPFDPPSSSEESLLDDKEEEPLSPGRAEYGDTEPGTPITTHRKVWKRKIY